MSQVNMGLTNSRFEAPKTSFMDTMLVDDLLNGAILGGKTDNIPKTLVSLGHCRKLVIQYENYRTFTISNPYDINVIRNKSGNIDIRYWVDETKTIKTEYGFQNIFTEREHIVHNQKVIRVKVEFHQDEKGVKEQKLYSFN
jgi:hypothetical protein